MDAMNVWWALVIICTSPLWAFVVLYIVSMIFMGIAAFFKWASKDL